ncbi:vWA domain-containing protein [Hamadaea tsunoensis]|uniref:vWA domain-containing protein n=1 Tax=Hamadaea tsunoensis TaxID=53368 RepID=UPI0004845CE9|nr:hypothetical protein [Hamadaea tsunoensis]
MMNPQAPELFVRTPVQQLALSKVEKPPHIYVVYSTVDGHVIDLGGGRVAGVTDRVGRGLKYRYDVDVSPREAHMRVNPGTLKSSEQVFDFGGFVHIGFRISDPAAFVRYGQPAGAHSLVTSRVMEKMRMICAQYPITRVGDAELAVNRSFEQPLELRMEGVTVYRCVASLSVDDQHGEHAKAVRAAEQQAVLAQHAHTANVQSAAASVEVQSIHDSHARESQRKLVETFSGMNIDESQLLKIFVAQNPANAATAWQLLAERDAARHQREDIRNEVSLRVLQFLVDNKLLTRGQLQQVLPHLTALDDGRQLWAVAAASAPAALPAGPDPYPTIEGSVQATPAARPSVVLGPQAQSAGPGGPAGSPYSAPAPAPMAAPAPANSAGPAAQARPATRPPMSTAPMQMRLPQQPGSTADTAASPVIPVAPPDQGTAAVAAPPVPAPAAPPTADVQPIYVLVDTSTALAPWAPQAQGGLTDLLREVGARPDVAATLRLAVFGIADTVREVVPLGPVGAAVPAWPPVAGASASFGSGFGELFRRVQGDVATLKSQGHSVKRPVVFLLLGAEPPADWSGPRTRLADRQALPAGPNIVAYGLGGTTPVTVRAMATRPDFAFQSADADLGAGLAAFWRSVTESAISTGETLVRGTPTLSVRDPEGFQRA